MNTDEIIQIVSPQPKEISKEQGKMIQQPIVVGVKEQSCSSPFKPLLSDIGDHEVSNFDHPSEQTDNFRINKSKSQNGSVNPDGWNNQDCKYSQSLLGKSLQAHQQQNYRDCGMTSRQQLFSIPQTSNRESLLFRSAQTIILDDQKTQKKDLNIGNQNKNHQSQQKTLKQQIPFIPIQQFTSSQQLKTNQYEILVGTNSIKQQNHSNHSQVFVPVNTVLIKLDQKKEEENIKQENLTVSSTIQQGIIPSKKFKIIKNVQVTIQPYKSQFTIIEMPKQQTKIQQSKKQLKIDVPPQPLKIENLFISSLRSKSQIKPPQSTAQKKLKPWERKKKVDNKPSQQVQNDPSIKPSQISNTLNSINSNDSLIDSIQHLQLLSNKNKEKPIGEQSNNTQHNPRYQIKNKDLFTSKLDSKLFNQNDGQFLQKIKENGGSQKIPSIAQDKKNVEQKSQSLKQPQDKPISFHFSSHHPFQKEAQLVKNSNGFKAINNLNEESKQSDEQKPIEQIKQVKEQPIFYTKQQEQIQNPKEVEEAPLEIKEQQDSCSSSSKNEIDINYNHNKKYQQQLHILNRQRIKQLEQQLRSQQKINKQLENSIALPLKMAISTIAGASVAGLAWILKKNKVGSLVLGVATTMATFVISN